MWYDKTSITCSIMWLVILQEGQVEIVQDYDRLYAEMYFGIDDYELLSTEVSV